MKCPYCGIRIETNTTDRNKCADCFRWDSFGVFSEAVCCNCATKYKNWSHHSSLTNPSIREGYYKMACSQCKARAPEIVAVAQAQADRAAENMKKLKGGAKTVGKVAVVVAAKVAAATVGADVAADVLGDSMAGG